MVPQNLSRLCCAFDASRVGPGRLLCRRGSHRGFRRLPRPAAYMKPSSSHTRTSDGRKTYLEWQGKAFGKQVRGTTILTHNHEGLIEHIQLYHSPLPVVVEFSRELAKRLEVERRSGC